MKSKIRRLLRHQCLKPAVEGERKLLSNLSEDSKVNCILSPTASELRFMTDIEKSFCRFSFNLCCEKEEEMKAACESGILDMRNILDQTPKNLTSIPAALQTMQCAVFCIHGLRAKITQTSHDKCVPSPELVPRAKFAFSKCCRLGHVRELGCEAETLRLDGSCVDIDECEAKTDLCLKNVEECVNTHGSYECRNKDVSNTQTTTVGPVEELIEKVEEELREKLIEKATEELTTTTTEGPEQSTHVHSCGCVHAGAAHQ